MALVTIEDYITEVRDLLQDTVDSPYRYDNAALIRALNNGLLEIRRIRPDLMINYFDEGEIPQFETDDSELEEDVPLDQMYRSALVYYIAGRAQLRDEENTQDARAAMFLNKFVNQLTEIKS